MELSADAVQVRRFMHVICVPFALRRSRDADSGEQHHDLLNLKSIELFIRRPWVKVEPFELPASTRTEHEAWDTFRPLQAMAYFHPHVRPLLGDPERVRCWRHGDVSSLRIALRHGWPAKEIEWVLPVLRCELWVFEPDIGLLLLELQEDRARPLDEVHRLLDSLRRLYAPYMDTADAEFGETRWFGGHCPKRVELLDREGLVLGDPGEFECVTASPAEAVRQFGPMAHALRGTLQPEQRALAPLAGHWRTLLAPLRTANDQPVAPKGSVDVCILGDDRASIMTWLAFDDVRQVKRGDWVRTCFADAPGSDKLPYAKQYLEGFEERHAYDRFWYGPEESGDSPSRVLVSGYAFTYAGNAGCPYFFANEKNGAHAIFRHLHVPMGLIAHVQKARLLSLAQRLSNVVSRDRTSGQLALPTQREVEDIYLQFIEFTQTAWFDEVTPQEQGQHLFSMWQRELGTAKLYEQVRQSLRDLYDYSELRSDRELNHSVAWFGLIALVLSALAVISGLFGMNEPSKEWMSLALPAEWQPRIFWGMTIFTLLGALTALIMGLRVARKNPPPWLSRLSRGKR